MNLTQKPVSRRGFVAGGSALAATAVFGAHLGPAVASAASGVVSTTSPLSGLSGRPHQLFAYHCALVHKAMGDKLTRIVADPAISREETTLALRTTRCPCCNTQISASFGALQTGSGAAHV